MGYMIEVGSIFFIERKITKKDVEDFAALSGDNNPIHLDENYASRSIFGKCICHGFLVGSYISAIFAQNIIGCVYISQNINFLSPVYINDKIKVIVELTNIENRKGFFKTEVFVKDRKVIEGSAILLLPK